MLGRLSIAKQGLIIVVFLLAVQLILVSAINVELQNTQKLLARERHVFAVVAQSGRIASLTQKLAACLAQDALKIKEMIGATNDIGRYQLEIASAMKEMERLAEQDESARVILEEQKHVLQEATKVYKEGLNFYAQRRRPEDIEFARKMLASGGRISERYDFLLARYKQDRINAPQRTSEALANLKRIIVCALIMNVFIGMGLALLFVRRVADRIGRLSANMARFQRKEQLLPPFNEQDEIGQLDQLFHEMVSTHNQATANEEALVDGAYDVICAINSEGEFISVNAACLRQWGYANSDLIGKNIEVVVPDVPFVRRQLDDLKNKSISVDFDTRVKRMDSEFIETQWSCYWSVRDKAAFCFVRDVSESNSMENMLKAREEQVRTLMRNVPVALFVVDEKGTIKSANHKMETLLHCQRASLLERNIKEVIESDVETDKIFGHAHFGSSVRCALRKFDGERLEAEITVRALDTSAANESATSTDTLVVVEDVAERARLEHIKNDFVCLLRENLRKPLLKVRSIVADSDRASADATKIDRIVLNCDRLLRLIDELLSVDSFRPGRIIGDLKPESVSRIVEAAVESLRDYSDKQSVSIKVEVSNITVMADFDRLVQVVVNLLSNAIKFSPKGSEVSIGIQETNGFVEVAITDSGRGVAAVAQETIFKPYMQASSIDQKQGTGLGLPICKTIIEAHRGMIGVTSGDVRGSRFWFLLPRVEMPL